MRHPVHELNAQDVQSVEKSIQNDTRVTIGQGLSDFSLAALELVLPAFVILSGVVTPERLDS